MPSPIRFLADTCALRITTLILVTCLLGFVGPASQADTRDQDNPIANDEALWIDLLDADLSKWEIFMGVPHTSVELPFDHPKSDDGTTGIPIGLNRDPKQVFSTRQEHGEVLLHVTGEIYAGLSTFDEFENYHLSLQFRWGEKKWPPRLNKKRDSGLLYHAFGEHGAFWNVWLRCLEFQIQESDCGDFIGLAGPKAFANNGETNELTGGYVSQTFDAELPHGQWNTLELFTFGDQALHVVNGIPVMHLTETQRADGESLTRGRIQLQSEAAEITYRRIRLRPIDAMPTHLLDAFERRFGQADK
ncbi:MAG: DUF1080 domain-containing protein [Planctomycetota bacterium]